MTQTVAFIVIALTIAPSGQAAKDNPASRVVSLLQGLKASIEADGQEEQKNI